MACRQERGELNMDSWRIVGAATRNPSHRSRTSCLTKGHATTKWTTTRAGTALPGERATSLGPSCSNRNSLMPLIAAPTIQPLSSQKCQKMKVGNCGAAASARADPTLLFKRRILLSSSAQLLEVERELGSPRRCCKAMSLALSACAKALRARCCSISPPRLV